MLRARNLAESVKKDLDGFDVPLYIEQFAEDFIHPTLTPQKFTFYEDPYAWAGLGSDIRFVSLV